MPEWTLCADLKVYARLQSAAKPATQRASPNPACPLPSAAEPPHARHPSPASA